MKISLFKKISGKKINLSDSGDIWRSLLYKIKALKHELPRFLFIRHSHTMDIIAVILVLTFATSLIIYVLYFNISSEILVDNKTPELTTETIDKLELWMEERSSEKTRPLAIPNQNIFEQEVPRP